MPSVIALRYRPVTGDNHTEPSQWLPAAARRPASDDAYEPPSIEDLGTLAELTHGIVPSTSDIIGPGSIH